MAKAKAKTPVQKAPAPAKKGSKKSSQANGPTKTIKKTKAKTAIQS